jgi:hypothetical protein
MPGEWRTIAERRRELWNERAAQLWEQIVTEVAAP